MAGYITYFDAPGKFPRLDAGWKAAMILLADGKWHSHTELADAIESTGLADSTAVNLLSMARHHEKVTFENRSTKPRRYRFFYKKR